MILITSTALSLFFNEIPTLAQVGGIRCSPYWIAAFVSSFLKRSK